MARVNDLWTNKDRTRSARYGKGSRWQAVWSEAGEERTKSFRTKTAAEDHLVWIQHNQKSGTYINPEKGRVFVRDLMDDWLATLVHYNPSTMATTRSDVAATILPHWGGVVLADITQADVQAWVAGMGKAPRTVQTIHGRFLSFLKWCVDQGRMAKNPAAGVNLPRGKKRTHIFLTVAQVTLLAEAINGRYKGVVWVLATTGLRIGELAELRVKDLDLRRRRVTISRAVVFVGKEAQVGPPKNKQTRTVPLTRTAAGYLEAAAEGKAPDALLFPTKRGRQIRANNFKRRDFDQAVEAANKSGAGISTELWVHDLRHTAASWAVQSGASVKSVQRMLGHATAAITLDVYAGLFDQDLDDVADRMEVLLGGRRKVEPEQNPNAGAAA